MMIRHIASQRIRRIAWLPLILGACIVLLALSAAFANGDTNFSPHRPTLRPGDRGPNVILLQHTLFRLGFLYQVPNGDFDAATETAVRAFQSAEQITVDGIVGPQTWSALARAKVDFLDHVVQAGETLWDIGRRYHVSVDTLAHFNHLEDPGRIFVGQTIRIPLRSETAMSGVGEAAASSDVPPFRQAVELLHWNDLNPLFPNGSHARVIDVATGLSFEVRRLFGTFHADVEPVTAADTEIMRKIVGGWTWERRAIVLMIGDRYFAASMNAQPHGEQSILDNGFPGHFCIHLLGSRTHGTRIVDPDHHRAILFAAGYQQPTQLWLQ